MPWCIEDLLESFGETTVPILIVDNSPDSDLSHPRVPFPPNVTIISTPQNIGISASWNKGLDLGVEQTLICSQFVRLSPMEHNRRPARWGLNHVAQGIAEHTSPYGLTFDDQGFHFISIGRAMVERIGRFDENFHPCYGEDDDYRHRMILADITMPNWGGSNVYSIAYGAQKRGGSVIVDRTGRMRNYYEHKYGSVPGHFPTPFNNPNNDLSYWPEVYE